MSFKPGTIVKIKPEWRDPKEDPADRYLVIEDLEYKSKVSYIDIDPKFSLGCTYVWLNDTLEEDTEPSRECTEYMMNWFDPK